MNEECTSIAMRRYGVEGWFEREMHLNSIFGLWFQRELEKIVENEQRRMHEIVIDLDKVRERRRGSTGA
ncbi:MULTISPECIES: hypothetical protein [Sorangium]|uniref:hypothetical protein n=1 Tax=Sorangium TaxID=39643 RepID=UPI003D9C2B7A